MRAQRHSVRKPVRKNASIIDTTNENSPNTKKSEAIAQVTAHSRRPTLPIHKTMPMMRYFLSSSPDAIFLPSILPIIRIDEKI